MNLHKLSKKDLINIIKETNKHNAISVKRHIYRQSFFIQMQKLDKIISDLYDIDCKTKKRKTEYVNARKIFICVYKKVHSNYLGINLDLASYLNCHHSSILHNHTIGTNHIEIEKDFRDAYERVLKVYENPHQTYKFKIT